ncbi:MAG: hypothetical protein M3Q58_08910 [Bacteroidota bacterium]|nr:hypothetical protein [Bacteroidota bacterium]
MRKKIEIVAIVFACAIIGISVSSCNVGQAGSADDQSTTTGGENTTVQENWTKESVKNHINDWKETPKEAANKMIDKYGVPDEVTSKRLVWDNKGDFAQTMITNVEINHDFPMPHKDCLLQTVNYDVPVEKYTDIANYDGSVILERTKGTMSARCDAEPANYLALNLAYDVAQGNKSVEEARKFYGETIVSLKKGEKPEYTQKLMFNPKKNTGDSDKTIIDKNIMEELMGKK